MLPSSRRQFSLSSMFSLVTRPLFSGRAPQRRKIWQSYGIEILETRQLLAADLSAVLVDRYLTISDVDATGKDNSLSVSVVGTDLVISDENEQFIAAPAGGTLSNGDKTLTIPLDLLSTDQDIYSMFTINAGGGADTIVVNSLGTAFRPVLKINGDDGDDSVTFQGAPSISTQELYVKAETISVNSALTVNQMHLTATGDDTMLWINAPVSILGYSDFVADKMAINASVSVTLGWLRLSPENDADRYDQVNIGAVGDATADTLELSDAELDRISAELIMIGYEATGTVTVSGDIEHAGDADISVFSYRNVVFSNGASWTTHDGDLRIEASSSNGTGINGPAVEIDGGRLTSTGSGFIALYGVGGNVGQDNVGVSVHDGAVIESTGTGAIYVTGLGGVGTSGNRGVEISGAETEITSVTGEIKILGTGGLATGDQNLGVWLRSGASVTSTGTAPISIEGSGGSGVNENNGVMFNAYGNAGRTNVTTRDGNITIIGHGSESVTGSSVTGSGNRGIGMYEGSVIQSTGSGKISLDGTGRAGSDSSRGVELINDGTLITSATGDIQITGHGGADSSAYGVWMWGPAVESTGTANIRINATGGAAYDGAGFVAEGSTTRVSTVDGNISIVGHGGDDLSGQFSRGMRIHDSALIESTGTGTITLDGTGGDSIHSARGVELVDTGTIVRSVNGDILIKGQGGDNTSGIGIWLQRGAAVESTGTAKVTIDGTGGDATNSMGVYIDGNAGDAPTRISSIDGAISITGHGGNASAGDSERGVMLARAIIESTGTASITLNGTGGMSLGDSRGIEIRDAETRITSALGDINITGQGGNGSSGYGVWILDGAAVESTGAAAVGINGTGGAGNEGAGVVVEGHTTRISTVNGDISIVGQGGDDLDGEFSRGMRIHNGALIESTGTGKITLDGTGGDSIDSARGVELVDTGTILRSVTGDILIKGQGGDNTSAIGIWLQRGAAVESTGTAKVTIEGIGGDATNSMGVFIDGNAGDAPTRISSVDGAISITGHGGNAPAGDSERGVMLARAIIESTGIASITLVGTGGTSLGGSAGVEIRDPETRVTSTVGSIQITGQGGSGSSGYGVWIANQALVTSDNGNLQITGHGGDETGDFNVGVLLQNGGGIQSTGTAQITVQGTAGSGSASVGIWIENDFSAASITSSAGTGNITLITNSLYIDKSAHPSSIDAGANPVTILPLSDGTPINLGSAGSSGVLGLLDADLDRITAGTLTIGSSASGDMVLSASLTRPVTTNLQLVTGGDLLLSGGSVDTAGGLLRLQSGGSPRSISPTHAGVDASALTTTLSGGLSIALNGPVPDTEYTQLNLLGGGDLNGAKLQLTGSYMPPKDTSFVIVNSTAGDAVIGTFQDLAEGAIIGFNGRLLQITYHGGANGNDVILTSLNLPPVVTDTNLSATENLPATGTLMATDPDLDSLSFSFVTNAQHGTVVITDASTGAYTYTPNTGYYGPDSFAYLANDGLGNSNVATATITVNAVPQLALNGDAVIFNAKAARKGGPIRIVPHVTVSEPDVSPALGIGGGTLSVTIGVSARVTRKGVKLDDTIGGLAAATAIGTTTGPSYEGGILVLHVLLNANTTAGDVQSFLRRITFETSTPGLKLLHRVFVAQVTDTAGAVSNTLQQTITVTKK